MVWPPVHNGGKRWQNQAVAQIKILAASKAGQADSNSNVSTLGTRKKKHITGVLPACKK